MAQGVLLGGQAIREKLLWNDLPVELTGDAAIIAPPLVAEKDRIDAIVRILRETLQSAMKKAA